MRHLPTKVNYRAVQAKQEKLAPGGRPVQATKQGAKFGNAVGSIRYFGKKEQVGGFGSDGVDGAISNTPPNTKRGTPRGSTTAKPRSHD